jgi:hypothetical protein
MSNNDIVRGGGAVLGSPLQQHDPNSAKFFHGVHLSPREYRLLSDRWGFRMLSSR